MTTLFPTTCHIAIVDTDPEMRETYQEALAYDHLHLWTYGSLDELADNIKRHDLSVCVLSHSAANADELVDTLLFLSRRISNWIIVGTDAVWHVMIRDILLGTAVQECANISTAEEAIAHILNEFPVVEIKQNLDPDELLVPN